MNRRSIISLPGICMSGRENRDEACCQVMLVNTLVSWNTAEQATPRCTLARSDDPHIHGTPTHKKKEKLKHAQKQGYGSQTDKLK